MGKIAEITNAEQERAFDLIREPDALYLCVKCSDSKKHSKPSSDPFITRSSCRS